MFSIKDGIYSGKEEDDKEEEEVNTLIYFDQPLWLLHNLQYGFHATAAFCTRQLVLLTAMYGDTSSDLGAFSNTKIDIKAKPMTSSQFIIITVVAFITDSPHRKLLHRICNCSHIPVLLLRLEQ